MSDKNRAIADREKSMKESGPVPMMTDGPIVVGIGASAGGLSALTELFQHIPADTGLCFVVVQHLKADQKTMLAPLLQSKSAIPVTEVIDHTRPQPDHVHVIAPGRLLELVNGELRSRPLSKETRHQGTINALLNSLGKSRGNSAVGILLSGSGSDGTEGMCTIKSEGGITFAQEQTSAQFSEMPASAIKAGCVDLVLKPSEIAEQLRRLTQSPLAHPRRLQEDESNEINKLLLLIKNKIGHNFTQYKRNTVRRRVLRRMLLKRVSTIRDYTALVEKSDEELKALNSDLLINVTAFFRDPDAFETIKKNILPLLLSAKPPDQALRIWVPACSTGEEAYSLAMILTEYLEEQKLHMPIQIFATDIDVDTIVKARAGKYQAADVANLSPQRLQRFFISANGGYQVSKRLRSCCIFSVQNAVQDPPFSRLDLISCRNLLIYLDQVLQSRLFLLFHFGLQPWGYLFLGASESVSEASTLFSLIDKKHKIYSKKKTGRTRLPLQQSIMPPMANLPLAEGPAPTMNKSQEHQPDLQKEAEQLVLEEFAPPGVIIDAEMNIAGFIGHTGPFIDPAPGSVSLKLLKMAQRDLLLDLRAAIMEAMSRQTRIEVKDIRFEAGGKKGLTDIVVIPLKKTTTDDQPATFYLILFTGPTADRSETSPATPPSQVGDKAPPDESREKQLEEALRRTQRELKMVINDHIATNEALHNANEQIQSSNEELQSTNEELVSAQEELQSTNEELATLNDELEARNADLAQANADLTNLLSSVHLPVLMLNKHLQIRQFTPAAKPLLNIIESDIGRPFTDLSPNVVVPDLKELVQDVIKTGNPKTTEMPDQSGTVFSVNVSPYHDLEGKIVGAVLVFINVTNIKNVTDIKKV